MNTKERFVFYLDSKNIGQTAFELSSGLSRGQLAKKQGFNSDSLEKIAVSLPKLNMQWLITGNGESEIETIDGESSGKIGDLYRIKYEKLLEAHRELGERYEKSLLEMNEYLRKNTAAGA